MGRPCCRPTGVIPQKIHQVPVSGWIHPVPPPVEVVEVLDYLSLPGVQDVGHVRTTRQVLDLPRAAAFLRLKLDLQIGGREVVARLCCKGLAQGAADGVVEVYWVAQELIATLTDNDDVGPLATRP